MAKMTHPVRDGEPTGNIQREAMGGRFFGSLDNIRQSTPRQVLNNQESTRRQYQLAERARQMGWAAPQVEVIDEDLGLSGASSHLRTGFQRLVAAIGLGEVGIILVTEVSRLSRRNSDWHRVLELCAVFRTLIADEDRVYVRIRRGPRNFGRGVVKWSHGD
jgi:hypothetical protein